MRLDTRALDFELSDMLAGHVERHVRTALAPLRRRVHSVTVRLEDVNADRGGVDKRCRLVVALRRRGVVTVQAVSDNLYTAITRAAERARLAALRAVGRPRTRARRLPRRAAARAVA